MRRELRARGYLLAERIDLKHFEQGTTLATAPLTVELKDSGIAVLFRYGAVVLFGMSDSGERVFLSSITRYLSDPLTMPEVENLRIVLSVEDEDDLDAAGILHMKELSPQRLQTVADIVAKALVLARYESEIASVFDRIEPLAARLKREGRTDFRERDLLRLMGNVLLTQHKMVGRVEAIEKPEVLWEHPELERLHVRLEAEYEIRERARALERKFDLITKTSEVLTGLLQSKRSLNVELYIMALIVIELLLSVYTIVAARLL